MLPERRLKHSLNVSKCAVKLSEIYNCDKEKAKIAGLVHDCAKYFNDEQIEDCIKKFNIELDPLEENNLALSHSVIGSYVAKEVFEIEDEEILDAIRYHTTGKANMTMLEQIIYLADFISADRDYKDIDIIRKETQRGIEYGLLYGTAYTIKSVASRQILLHPMTVEAYNWIIDEYFN